jgi:predicted metal-dependent phosphoesterase TrpH
METAWQTAVQHAPQTAVQRAPQTAVQHRGSRARWVSAAAVILASLAVGLQGGAPRADEIVPAAAAPRWWKGNLHTHTFWSDGDDFPEMVAEWYRTHGYHFLALSDHNVLSQGIRWDKERSLLAKGGAGVVNAYLDRFGPAWVERRGSGDGAEIRLKPLDELRSLVEERGRFILIPAEEITDKAEGVPVHINATNLRDPIQPVGGRTVTEAINANLRAVRDQAERAGREILAHLNHPNYGYAVTAEDLAHAVLERHFEIHNGHPGVNQRGDALHPSVDRMWDIANTIRLVDLGAAPLFGVATDDSHAYHGQPGASHPGRGWMMVRATHLTPEKILSALAAGDAYASTGVTLRDVVYDAGVKRLTVEVEPEAGADYTVQFIGTRAGVDTAGMPIDPATLDEAARKSLGRLRLRHSGEIGAVLATVKGPRAEYTFTGRELYVRAMVMSSLPVADPSWEGQMQQAWTQPAGWTAKEPGWTAKEPDKEQGRTGK